MSRTSLRRPPRRDQGDGIEETREERVSDDSTKSTPSNTAAIERKKAENYIGGDPHDADEPIDYFVWAIVGPSGTFVVDTGFDAAMAKKRGRADREADRRRAEGDRHRARQGRERHHLASALRPLRQLRHLPERALPPAGHRDGLRDRPLHVPPAPARPVRGGGRGRDGAQGVRRPRHASTTAPSQVAPGITVHKIGGHSKGLQCVQREDQARRRVLASDTTHLYSHIDEGRVFPDHLQCGRGARRLRHDEAAGAVAQSHRAGARPAGAEALPGGASRASKAGSRGSTSIPKTLPEFAARQREAAKALSRRCGNMLQ